MVGVAKSLIVMTDLASSAWGKAIVHKLADDCLTLLTIHRNVLILSAASAQAGVPATQSYAVLLYDFFCAIPFGRDWLVAGT